LKIKDLRNKADEVARTIFIFQQEGLEPPSNLPLYFQSLLHFIAVLYAEDPLELELCLEFWSSDMACAGVNYRYVHIHRERFCFNVILSHKYLLYCLLFKICNSFVDKISYFQFLMRTLLCITSLTELKILQL